MKGGLRVAGIGFHRDIPGRYCSVARFDATLQYPTFHLPTLVQTCKRRAGVLQEAHPHALLLSGMTNFDKLLPGMLDEVQWGGGLERPR